MSRHWVKRSTALYSIDTAVMERSKQVWTLPVSFHWSDVGTWLSLAEELGVCPGGTRVVEGDLAFDDAGWTPGGGRRTRLRRRR